ncbi:MULTISPECIES: 4Fe-4S dicluster domain-containing protein [unclassified Arenimonas]|uniref:RdxA/RdxB/FixG family protein n=1 Tax=unclassified Arenimonas TaxID=2641713 RepID=UPI00086EC23C|nr:MULTISPECIES: 4Fe-4S dicluster domain-containing protein [unclassified Arenimonas]ODS62040.1 MAG: cytochrome c oxidase accessory protein CcoG [Arenimonas sp. SCN 70-307]
MAKEIPSELVEDVSLYVSEKKVYPREQDGFTQRLRKAAVIWLLGMYYGFAWLQWDDRQAVLWDLPARKFYVFGLVFWPQDFLYLALLMIMAGLALFFFTALAGRLWCGYACPQTVWTEVFIWMERWTEGDRNKRMKLDAGPWTREKVLRKGAKHALWLVFALWTGFTFVGYFTPIRDLAARLSPFEWGGWETFWVLFYSLATWGNAGVLREQVCKYMCPYARFQGAMFDRNTLIIAYDPMRGEPRGPRKKGRLASVLERARGLLPLDVATSAVVHAAQHRSAADLQLGARATTGLVVDAQEGLPPAPTVDSPDDLGDCIDCTICVQVCPTGIDIRNGLQYECIACGACVDACDMVMDKIGYPRGLIRYTTQNAVEGKRNRLLRPRVVIYALLLVALAVGWAVGVAQRSTLIVDVLRDRNALYRTAADGSIENGYTVRIVNKDQVPRSFRIRVEGPAGITLVEAGAVHAAAAEEVLTVPVTLRAPAGLAKGRVDVDIVVESDAEGVSETEETRFFGPF